MKVYVGVDGGGTRTRAVAIDERGRRVGRGEAGLSNLHHAPDEVVRANLLEAVTAALSSIQATTKDVVSAFFGMAGVTCEATAARFQGLAGEIGLGTAKVAVDHDIRIALAGGLAGRPGIALIVGTGSSCYGRDATGRHWQTGGWGCLVADEGSGYDIGRRAIVAAVRMADGREPATPLGSRVFAWLGVSGVSDILRRLYEQGIERNEIAALAPEVVMLAEARDSAALAVLDSGAADLADMVAANHRRLPTGPTPEVVITGGLGTALTLYRRRIVQEIVARLPDVRVIEPELEPVLGAVLLAVEQDAGTPDPEVVRRLKESGR